MIALQPERTIPAVYPARVPDGCNLFHDFSADTGCQITDHSGSGGHAIITGATVAAGPTGAARSFDGVDDTMVAPSSVPFAAEWTISAWLLPRAADAWSYFLGYSFGLRPEIVTEGDGGVAVYCWDNACARVDGAPFATHVNRWMHLVVTFDAASHHKIFVNGEPLALSLNDDPGYTAAVCGFYVSRADAPFSALFGEVFALNHTMAAVDVASYYRETAWRYVG